MALTIGDRLRHYDVTALLGSGGMGEVYKATDTRLDHTVAPKVLAEHSRLILIASASSAKPSSPR